MLTSGYRFFHAMLIVGLLRLVSVLISTLFGETFFFSSRRRHTRLQGDWSSDVSSSDLYAEPTSDPSFGGVSFELVYDNPALTGETFAFTAGHADPVTLPFATPAAINTGTVRAVAYDVNGNSNGIVLGVTPSFQVQLGTTTGTIGSTTSSVFIPAIAY